MLPSEFCGPQTTLAAQTQWLPFLLIPENWQGLCLGGKEIGQRRQHLINKLGRNFIRIDFNLHSEIGEC